MKKTYNKLKALTASFGLLALGAGAQISGVVTINSTQGTAGTNYQSFTALATALNTSGINGPLTVNVVTGTGPYTEQPAFNQIVGANSSNRIVINGNGNTLQFNSSNSSQPWTLGLNGTDYMTVNSLNILGQGATYAMVVVLSNGADNNRFNNCTFVAPLNGTSSYHVPFAISSSMISPSGGSNSGNYNSVTSCTMSNGYYGLFNYGLTSAPFQQGNSFISCRVTDFYVYGMYYPYQMNCTVKYCTIDRMTRTSSTTVYGMLNYYQQGGLMEGNKVWKLFESNQGANVTCYAWYSYYTSQSGGIRNIVRNNIITDIKSVGTIYGMMCYYMNADIYNNTVDLDWVAGNQSGTIYAMYPYGGVGYVNNITNNIVTCRRGGSGTRYGMYFGGVTGNITCDRNNIVVTSTLASSYVGYYSSAASTISQWTAQIDPTGMSVDPTFSNQALGDLHPTNAAMNNTAIPLGILFDQEQAVRDQATPDIGALEFMSPTCGGTPPLNAITSPTYAICPGEDVTMMIANLTSSTGLTYQWNSSSVSNVGPFTPIGGATSMVYTAPSVTSTTWFQVVQTCTNPGGSSTSPVGQVLVAGPTSTTVPYYENFEGIGIANRLPNCSWMATNLGSANKTYVTSNSGNRVPRSGVSFATFDNASAGTSSYYTNPIQMNVGITYSAALWFATEYFGYSNWSNLSIWVGPNQNSTGLVQVASVGPAISGPYKLLSNTFTVPTSGNYYVCIRATSSSGSAQFLSWDDLSITIPCQPGSPNAPIVTISASSQTICAGTPVNLTAAGANSFNWSTGASGASTSDSPTTNTVYAVTGLNSLTGCTSTQSLAVQVDPAPNVFAVANSPVSCAGSPVMITAFNANSYAWSNGAQGANVTVSPTVSTQYTVIGIGLNGCSGQYVANITVNPLPAISVLSSNAGEACKDDQLVLTASGAVTYMWYSSSSPNVYQGSPITITAGASAIYTVMGTNANGCVGKQTITQSVSDCTGLNEISAALNGVRVYPNPTSGVFTVELNNGADKTISVTDVTGRVIANANGTDASFNMNLSNLAAGIYYVKVQSESASTVLKVVKQ